MPSNFGDEKSNFHEGRPTVDGEDSLSVKDFSNISSEGITFLYIIEEREQFWVDTVVQIHDTRIQELFIKPSDLKQTQDG